MQHSFGQLTYCSNIHSGEEWQQHFSILQENIPSIKQAVCPDSHFGIGLRLANQASIDLEDENAFSAFQQWLHATNCYVFTMNGFPYGGFHDTVVKDQVHAPDWTTEERLSYTIRLFHLLAKLLPEELVEGGISTSPLSYRFWWNSPESLQEAIAISTNNMLKVVDELVAIRATTGKILHLDIEPEPDGIFDNGTDFIEWYVNVLRPTAIQHFALQGIEADEALEIITTHIQLCYDICHFAVSFEDPQTVVNRLREEGIKVGKIQISSAIKVDFSQDEQAKLKAIAAYNEPSYLHQVVALRKDGTFEKFADLGLAIDAFQENTYQEWRVHFHVPLFLETYGLLDSTQNDIVNTLAIHRNAGFTNHLEIETYTWGVLPAEVQAPLNESIIREIQWTLGVLEQK
jgi:hypothetical protein